MKTVPFLLAPAAKDYLWGGSKLNDDYAKDIPLSPLAETWECSTHPDGQSVVASGEFSGRLLGDVLRLHPEFLGSHPLALMRGIPDLPILVKLIDANRDLSVQVHPDDVYAQSHEGGLGKTEMWYILHAKPDARLVYGFKQDMDATHVRKALDDGSIGRYLNYVSVQKNDLFFIEAGIVHAIGTGIVLAEIQENSNITYRIYDYGRLDKNGLPRQLHIDKALKVAKLKSSAVPRQPLRVLKYRNGNASEFLSRCKYFQVERLLINTEIHREFTNFQSKENSFRVLLCIDGCGVMFGVNIMLNFFKGDCIFIPANSIPLKLHGKAEFLQISC